ncbi:glycosyltransferase family 2 protein [Neofusicoccum parvum]|nr:glycosyltransferase family 2 protein [Neofusicoccum parvum]
MVVLLDGKHRDVRSHMTKVIREFERPYISLKQKRGVLQIKAGFMEDVPVIVIEKVKNSGKKDSLVLCHDLFNYPRHNLPLYTQLLRKELWADILPILTEGENFQKFDMGTDRRLTYSMLSQSKKLHTLFVPEARRRWGSNAYFNNYFYWMGEKMILITRIAASIEVIRLSFVYYRILNTILFIKGLTEGFSFLEIMPLLVVSQLPTAWFMFCVFFLDKELKKRAFKLMIGYVINKSAEKGEAGITTPGEQAQAEEERLNATNDIL